MSSSLPACVPNYELSTDKHVVLDGWWVDRSIGAKTRRWHPATINACWLATRIQPNVTHTNFLYIPFFCTRACGTLSQRLVKLLLQDRLLRKKLSRRPNNWVSKRPQHTLLHIREAPVLAIRDHLGPGTKIYCPIHCRLHCVQLGGFTSSSVDSDAPLAAEAAEAADVVWAARAVGATVGATGARWASR